MQSHARLDNLLGGGVKCGEWTELAGQMSTGKTQTCFAASLHCAAMDFEEAADDILNTSEPALPDGGIRVLFLDCAGSFSNTRLVSMAEASPKIAAAEIEKLLSMILVVRISTPQSLLNHLTELADTLRSPVRRLSSPWTSLRLVVVDGLAPLLTPTLGTAKQAIGHLGLVEISRLLKSVIQQQHCAVLSTNWMSSTMMQGQSTSDQTKVLRPGLGESWTPVPHNRVLLTHSARGGEDASRGDEQKRVVVVAEVSHSGRVPSGHVIHLQLTRVGLSEF